MRRSDDLLPLARAVLGAERRRLEALGLAGELRLVGGCSVPGAVTRGDVDLHLRVPPEAFDPAVEALRACYEVVHPEIWLPTLATFAVPGSPLPTGVAVTPRGSEHDVRFTLTWRRIAAEPDLLAAYNALKRGDDGDEARKAAFFDRLVAGGPPGLGPGGPPGFAPGA